MVVVVVVVVDHLLRKERKGSQILRTIHGLAKNELSDWLISYCITTYSLHLSLNGILVSSLLSVEGLQFGDLIRRKITSVLTTDVDFVVLKIRGLRNGSLANKKVTATVTLSSVGIIFFKIENSIYLNHASIEIVLSGFLSSTE